MPSLAELRKAVSNLVTDRMEGADLTYLRLMHMTSTENPK